MGKKIEFPNANKAQNKILNQIAEQKEKEMKAKEDKFDEEKDRDEFLYLWKHFSDRLQKMLKDFRDDLQPKGYHSLEIQFIVKKDDSTDALKEKFIYGDKLKLFKITEIE
jgi:gas vesicle protein